MHQPGRKRCLLTVQPPAKGRQARLPVGCAATKLENERQRRFLVADGDDGVAHEGELPSPREVTTDNVRMTYLSLAVAVLPEGQKFTGDEIGDDTVTVLSAALAGLLNMTDLQEIMERLDTIRNGVYKVIDHLEKLEAKAGGGAS